MKNYNFLIAAILPLLLACNANKKANTNLVIPGKSIGTIAIGQNADSLVKVMGKPDDSNSAMGSSMYTWYDNHDTSATRIGIFAQRNMGAGDEEIAHVKKIMVNAPQYKTKEGVGIGNTLNEIGKYYGLRNTGTYALKGQNIIIYSDLSKGLSFDINSDTRKCIGIAVYPENEAAMAYINVH